MVKGRDFMAVKQKITTFNNDTGQIYNVKERAMYNPFDPERGYNFKYKSLSIKSYLDIPLPDVFSDSEIGKIFRLSRHIYGNTNMLGKRTNSYIHPYTQEDILKVLGLKDRQGRGLLKKIVENRVMRKYECIEQGNTLIQYYFNPMYFFSGTYINANLYLLFQDDLVKHLSNDVINKYLEQLERKSIPSTNDSN